MVPERNPDEIGPLPDGPTPRPGGATTAQVKAKTTTEKTGKADVLASSHGLSRLGTNDEAGGAPASPELIDQMVQLEPDTDPHSANSPGRHDTAPNTKLQGLLLTLLVVLALAAVWFFLLRAD